MRGLTSLETLPRCMRALAVESKASCRIYLKGGASAVLLHWRATTIDIDLKLVPEEDRVLRAISILKETLGVNVKLASPGDFIPELPGWAERSQFIVRESAIDYYHYDFYSQCLAKIERGHVHDRDDVHSMLKGGLVQPRRLLDFYAQIEPHLYRYPAITPASFHAAVQAAVEPYLATAKNNS